MIPTSDLFLHVFVWIDDAIKQGDIVLPKRPGPRPACTDAEVLTIAVVRYYLARPSESGFLEEVRLDWRHLFPKLPHQSEFNRRVRWLWGACEALRHHIIRQVPEDTWQQVDTSALPVKHPSRVRGPDQWQGPNDLYARFGRDEAHREWFYGFRLAIRTDLASRLVRSWSIVPAAVDERRVADDLLAGALPSGLLLDQGFMGRAWAAYYAEQGVAVVLAPTRAQRRQLPRSMLRPIAVLRNRIETTLGEITYTLDLAWHQAKTFWGLLTRTAGIVLAHTLRRLRLFEST